MKMRLWLTVLLLSCNPLFIFKADSITMLAQNSTSPQAPSRILLTHRQVDGLSIAGGAMFSIVSLLYLMHLPTPNATNPRNSAAKLEMSSTLGFIIVFVLRALLIRITRL